MEEQFFGHIDKMVHVWHYCPPPFLDFSSSSEKCNIHNAQQGRRYEDKYVIAFRWERGVNIHTSAKNGGDITAASIFSALW